MMRRFNILDDNLISALSIIVNDKIKENISSTDSKKRINALFHNKSNKTIVNELTNYIEKKDGKAKNFATVIVILSLLIRNLDCDTELISLIKNSNSCNKFINCLYGGLISLLSGKTKTLSLKIDWNYRYFTNKLEFIERTADFDYWQYSSIIQSVKIIEILDYEKFKILAIKDKTKLILLSVINYHLKIKITDNLIENLLNGNDEIHKNIGFYFLTINISRNINELSYKNRCIELGFPTNTNYKSINNSIKKETQKCLSFLEVCNNETQCELLFNYFLINQSKYPYIFAKKLLSSELQDDFIIQIRLSQKIRTLKDISCLVYLVYNTPALNKNNKRISKGKVYDAITDLLINFINDRKIYTLDKQNLIYICNTLPKKCARKLEKSLTNERKKLMCESIDRLLRFNIFIKDKHQAEIVDDILKVLTENDFGKENE